MLIEFADLSPSRIYFTLIQSVIPRPVAWILSDSGTADYNLAPFSYFNAVCSDPPLLMVSIGKKADGSLKDTRRNIVERSHFVVHIAHRELASALNESSAELSADASELVKLGLQTVPFGNFPLPRLRDCRIALACERYHVMEVGPLPQAIIFGLIRQVYIDDNIIAQDAKGRLNIDAVALDPIARLGGEEYVLLGDVITLPRPR